MASVERIGQNAVEALMIPDNRWPRWNPNTIGRALYAIPFDARSLRHPKVESPLLVEMMSCQADHDQRMMMMGGDAITAMVADELILPYRSNGEAIVSDSSLLVGLSEKDTERATRHIEMIRQESANREIALPRDSLAPQSDFICTLEKMGFKRMQENDDEYWLLEAKDGTPGYQVRFQYGVNTTTNPLLGKACTITGVIPDRTDSSKFGFRMRFFEVGPADMRASPILNSAQCLVRGPDGLYSILADVGPIPFGHPGLKIMSDQLPDYHKSARLLRAALNQICGNNVEQINEVMANWTLTTFARQKFNIARGVMRPESMADYQNDVTWLGFAASNHVLRGRAMYPKLWGKFDSRLMGASCLDPMNFLDYFSRPEFSQVVSHIYPNLSRLVTAFAGTESYSVAWKEYASLYMQNRTTMKDGTRGVLRRELLPSQFSQERLLFPNLDDSSESPYYASPLYLVGRYGFQMSNCAGPWVLPEIVQLLMGGELSRKERERVKQPMGALCWMFEPSINFND
jgi:hypothetical protein